MFPMSVFGRNDVARLAPAVVAEARKQLLSPVEDYVNKFFDEFTGVKQKRKINVGFPRMDVYESSGKYVVEYAIPGVDPANVQVEVIEGVPNKTLKVSGSMSKDFEHQQDAGYIVKELSRKHFSRSMLLPQHLQGDPKATYKNGMLTLAWETPVESAKAPATKSIPVAVETEKT